MKKLFVGFSKPRSKLSFISYVIRWLQGTPFSHVYVRFESDFLERTFIYQASGSKVNFENIYSFSEHSVVVEEFDLSVAPAVYKKVLGFAIDTVGKPYSLKQLLGMAVVCIFKKLGRQIRNPYKDRKDAFICSEIGAYVLEESGQFIDYDKDSIGPKEIWNILKSRK